MYRVSMQLKFDFAYFLQVEFVIYTVRLVGV